MSASASAQSPDAARDLAPPTAEGVTAAHGHDTRICWTMAAYSLLIAAASLAGGSLPGRIELTHARMQHIISFVGGLMLGIGVFHLYPHAVQHLGADKLPQASWGVMYGIIVMFLLLRTFHFHQHEVPAPGDDDPEHPPHQHSHDHHAGHAGHSHSHAEAHVHELGWVGVCLGLGLHSLIDGVALGASIRAQAAESTGWALLGLGTFAAILLHKPLDAVSITSLMKAGGWSQRWQFVVNLAFACLCPLGMVLFMLGLGAFDAGTDAVGYALAFSAGVFLCISLSDLLPEMEFHSHHQITLTVMLLLGIALAWGIGFLEPGHAPRM